MLLGVAPNKSVNTKTPSPVFNCLISARPSSSLPCGSSSASTDNTLMLDGTLPSTCCTQSTRLPPNPLWVINKIPTTFIQLQNDVPATRLPVLKRSSHNAG